MTDPRIASHGHDEKNPDYDAGYRAAIIAAAAHLVQKAESAPGAAAELYRRCAQEILRLGR